MFLLATYFQLTDDQSLLPVLLGLPGIVEENPSISWIRLKMPKLISIFYQESQGLEYFLVLCQASKNTCHYVLSLVLGSLGTLSLSTFKGYPLI